MPFKPLEVLHAVNSLIAMLLGLAITLVLGSAGWIGYNTYYAEKFALEDTQNQLVESEAKITGLMTQLDKGKQKINALSLDVEQKTQQIVVLNKDVQRLETSMKLLKTDHRVAQVTVLGQEGSVEEDNLQTTFSFVELNENGEPMEQPRSFTIGGDLLYLDAWVVKFKDEHVEQNDPQRSTSIFLFRRVFGESQRPIEGFQLDPVGAQPTAYKSGNQPNEWEQAFWTRFWDYANNPIKAEKAGVRAAHGEAPSIKLMLGRRYRVELRASDGLTIVPELIDESEQQASRVY